LRSYVLPLAVALLSLPALAAPPEGLCEVKVSGGLELAYQGQGGSTAVSSDHWYTEEEIRASIEATARVITQDPVKLQTRVARYMEDGGNLTGPLVLHCAASAGRLSFLAGKHNTLKSVPFKPGKYRFAHRKWKRAGEFIVTFRANDVTYSVSGPGEFILTRFDATGVAGTFQFPAKVNVLDSKPGTPEHTITVVGNFNFPCPADTELCRKARKP
jgi:hypothetical protein